MIFNINRKLILYSKVLNYNYFLHIITKQFIARISKGKQGG